MVGCYDGALYLIRAATGDVVSKVQTADAVKSSPCIDPSTGTIVFGSHDGCLYAVTEGSWALAWHCNVAQAVQGPHATASAVFSSVTVDDVRRHVVCATLSGIVAAISIDSHNVVWSAQLPGAVFSSPLVHAPSGSVIVGCTDHRIYCVDRGAITWSFQTSAPVFSTPVHATSGQETVAVIGSHDTHVYCIALDGRQLWSYAVGSAVASAPAVVGCGDNVQFIVAGSDGRIVQLDWDGLLVRELRLPGPVYASPVVAPDGSGVVVGCRDDRVYFVSC